MAGKRGHVLLAVLIGVFICSGICDAALTTIGTAAYEGGRYNLIYEDDNNGQGLVWRPHFRACTSEAQKTQTRPTVKIHFEQVNLCAPCGSA